MYPRIGNKEIFFKTLQDLPILPIFTVLLSKALARGFADVSMERNSIDSFGASSTDYHPCIMIWELFSKFVLLFIAGHFLSQKTMNILMKSFRHRLQRLRTY